MNIASISSVATLAFLVALSCNFPARNKGGETKEAGTTTDTLRFDPLDLPADREVVPATYPVAPAAHRGETVMMGDGGDELGPPDSTKTGAVDSAEVLGGQAFKVQLFTSKLFGEAKQARRVAEEIFDQPVTMDYEVPYFKVRVGSFADRYAAEGYAQRVRAAGFEEAWVVAATASVRKAAPLYDEGSDLPGFGDSTTVDTLPPGGSADDD